jgi:hypothetical protein
LASAATGNFDPDLSCERLGIGIEPAQHRIQGDDQVELQRLRLHVDLAERTAQGDASRSNPLTQPVLKTIEFSEQLPG